MPDDEDCGTAPGVGRRWKAAPKETLPAPPRSRSCTTVSVPPQGPHLSDDVFPPPAALAGRSARGPGPRAAVALTGRGGRPFDRPFL